MNVGRHILVYFASSLISGLVPLMLLPLLTRELQPSEYGTMVTVTTLVALVLPVVNWGILPYLGVQYFRTEIEEFRTLFSTIWLIPIISMSILIAGATFLHPWLGVWLDMPGSWVVAIPILAAAFFLPLVAQNLLRMMRRPYIFAAIELFSAIANFGLTVALLTATEIGWQSRIISVLCVNLIVSFPVLIWLRKMRFIGSVQEPKLLRPAVIFGSGVVPHDLANNSMRYLDRVLVAVVLGQVAVGQYAVAAQVASVMLFMLSALNKAWTPFVFQSLAANTEEARILLVRYTYLIFLSLILFFGTFNLVMPFVFYQLVDERYHGSFEAIFWLTLGYLFNGFYLTVVDRIFFSKKTHQMALVTVSSAIIYVCLSYHLLSSIGTIGVAIAFACTSAFAMLVVFMLAQRHSPLPWLAALKP